MRELIGRLEVTDDDAASALRVIAHFDGLVDDRASGPAMLRAAAALAGCPAAHHDSGSGGTRRVDAAGRSMEASGWRPGWPRVTLDAGREGVVWLERDGSTGPLDQLILERLAKALGTTAGPRVAAGRVAHTVRVACDLDLTMAERRPAIEALGLSGPVTVWVLGEESAPTSARTGTVDGLTVVLQTRSDQPPVATGPAGFAESTPEDLPLGVAHARTALRLSGFGATGPIAYEELGALAGLVEQLSPEWACSQPDVAVLEGLLPQHPWLPQTVSALVGHGSMRQAAAELHVHHSTLQERVTWLESRLGFAVLSGAGRERLALTWSLWRVARSAP